MSRKNSMAPAGYGRVLHEVVGLLESARRASARAVNSIITASYWQIGRRIVEFEQSGQDRADYGNRLIEQLARDLNRRFGRGFSERNLYQMRSFYLAYPKILQTVSAELAPEGKPLAFPPLTRKSARAKTDPIFQTLSGKSTRARSTKILQTASAKFGDSGPSPTRWREFLEHLAQAFPLPWSHYVGLLSVDDAQARSFYETEAIRGGWTVRQLDRQINTRFYERTMLSRNPAAMIRKGEARRTGEALTPEEEIKDPFILEFLGLKDEYSESDLEEALLRQLENFLLELGGDFAFLGRQRRLRIGNEWYRVDLVFFHRQLRCLVLIDLKLGKFTHADTGQMHMYLNYARTHWTHSNENPPVGLILCAHKDAAVAHYSLDGLPTKIMAAEYRMALPDQKAIAAELARTRKDFLARSSNTGKRSKR